MRAQAARSIICTLAALALSGLVSPAASAEVRFSPCPAAAGFECGSLGVPLDRAGGAPGAISLSIERRLAGGAGGTPGQSAIVALAGGPGQPALPFAPFMASVMAPGLKSRDLLVFDQRGTGSSDALDCPAAEAASNAPFDRVLQRCAEQLGPARGGFTTEESVQDIEALRVAAGYRKLVLYGTSYGTKVALQYAERYPQHVEALVLDSVVPPEGREPFETPSLRAISPALRELCSGSLCAGITTNPVADLDALVRRLRAHPVTGSVYDGSGHRHNIVLHEHDLLDLIDAGDVNPGLRALLPAAMRQALYGYPDPLLRLATIAAGLVPTLSTASTGESEEDSVLLYTTLCEEAPFPWQRGAAVTQRREEAVAALRAIPASEFAPFDAGTAIDESLIDACDRWPDASPAPPAQAPLPPVPTLMLSGRQDLRTPAVYARRVAQRIPGAELEEVSFTGHSVVGADLTGCATKAIGAFFAGAALPSCDSGKDPLPPTPASPRSLGQIAPPAGLAGNPGRTLIAALDTLLDLTREATVATLQLGAELPSGTRFGGLHGGYARITRSAVFLHQLTLVPGVELSGTVPLRDHRLQAATLRLSGPSAAHGTIRYGGAGSTEIGGVLDGRRFHLLRSRLRTAASGSTGAEWPQMRGRPLLGAATLSPWPTRSG